MEPNRLLPADPSRHILLGDFNYSYSSVSHSIRAPTSWLQFLANHFVDCINDDESPGSSQATFHRGNSQSCIDYIFASSDIAADRGPGKVTYVQPAWTDHFLVSTSFRLRSITSSGNAETPQDMGKGLWRAHPRLARDPEFCDSLAVALSETVAGFDDSMFATLKWEDLKLTATRVAKSFSRRKAFTMAKAEECLQRKRRRILKNMKKNPDNIDELQPQLKVIEEQLNSYQQFHVETLALRSGLRWRELGELSAGYLKRTVATRSAKQHVPPLIHPETQVICNTKNEMLDAASTFYSSLYSPEPVDQSAIDDLLGALPDSLKLSTTAQSLMEAPLTFDDIVEGVSRSPRRSSPGSDGLPYEILSLIVSHADCRDIVLAVYNDALCYGVFPSSWKETCVSILPKKGNLADLKNWRPISLINTDAKVYTRILNARIIQCVAPLINSYQSGFMRHRFIADNGLLMRLVMDHAQNSGSTAIGLLLDQEKAYDRVHPDYLRQVLHKFEFPSKVVDSLMSLFFGTSLRLNINGFLSDPVSQLRGLRQGDPISPILFNLAFEPWLRKILLDTSFKGFSLPLSSLAHPQDENLQAVKLLAYADDVLCLLRDPGDLRVLQSHLSLYSRASNAKVNFHKTQVLSLSGSPLIYPSVWRDPLLNHNISHWHDCRSLEPLIYLGFPLCSSSAQRNFFLDNLLHKIRISCNLHSQRSLSIRGRVTILNTLVLSKLWHVLRLTSAPLSFFDKVKSLMSSFLTFRMFPKISLSSMCRPRSLGGLGVLDPLIQQGALQLRWIIPLLSDCVTGPLSTFWVSPVLNRASIILPRLTNFLLHHLSSFPVLNPLSNLGLPFDHRLSFLFPDLRPNALRRLDGVLALLFRSMDLLPKEFTSVVLSATTCLSLPVSAIVSPPADDALIPRTLSRLLCEISYVCDSQTNRLRPKRRPEFDHHPNLGKKLLKLARNDDIRLTPFFIRSFIPAAYAHLGPRPFVPVEHQTIDASPFLLSLQLATVEEQPCLSSKQYRRQCLRSTQSGSESSNETLPSHKWLQFWSFPILHACRNVWYRLLHQKIPHKSLLHRLLPTHFTSAQCPVCLTAEDTLLHFVFQCPAKLAVWRYVWRKYFPLCPFSPEHVQKTVISLKFPLVPLRSTLAPASVIIGHTLLAIWRAHWQLVFDNRPFDSLLVSHSATRLIQTSVQEQLVKRYMVHAPIPHIVL